MSVAVSCSVPCGRHGDFLILRNYEMKAEIYCFVNYMTTKYGILYIVIGRKIAYRGITFVPNEIFNFYYFRLGRKVLIRAKQYLSS
jgi:hypothetical protein